MGLVFLTCTPLLVSVLTWRHLQTLEMKRSLFCFWILLWTLMGPPLATQTCTELLLKNVNSSTLYTKEGNNVSVVFQFTTVKCPRQPERILVKVTSDSEGYIVEYCRVAIDNDSCETSDTSLCRCLDKSGLIEFSKKVKRTDNRRYTWIWSDSLSQFEGHRSIRFYVIYPPPLPPTIHGVTEGQPLSVGETLAMTCTVTGGNPLVAAVRFTCGDDADNQDNVSNGSVSSSLTFNPVTAEHNGVVCLCTAVWSPTKELYPFEKSIVLTVSNGSPVKGAEQSQSHGTVAAITVTFVIIGVAVSAVVTYFVFRKKADLYDHLKRSRQSVSYRVTGSARTAPSLKAIDGPYENETYEDVSDNSVVPSAPCDGIVSVKPVLLPGKTCKGKSLIAFTCGKNKRDEPGRKAPVSATAVLMATAVETAETQIEGYLEPVVASRLEDQSDQSSATCPADYYSYPKVAYKKQRQQW